MKKFIPGKELLDIWTFRNYMQNLTMLGLKIPLWFFQKMLFFIPLKQNQMIIYSLKQKGYSCNLKYLTEYITRNCKDSFQMLWIVKNNQEYRQLKQYNIPVATLHSWSHFLYRHRAKIIVTNDEFYPVFIKRHGQIYVNTWHGGINYKKIGYAGIEFTNPIQKLIYKLNNPQPDIFLSGSSEFTENTSEAFGFPKTIFLPTGLPRNDILFQPNSELMISVRKQLGLSEQDRVLLYAPTFRKGKTKPSTNFNYDGLLATLNQRFGGIWKILVRQHYFISEDDTNQSTLNMVINVSEYEDMQELLLISDCMISDYSSCMWDFSFTGRPCFVYAEDLFEYSQKDRSFSIPPTKWPYPLCQNEDELYAAILTFDCNTYQKQVKDHHIQMGAYDKGNACEQLVCEIQKRLKD